MKRLAVALGAAVLLAWWTGPAYRTWLCRLVEAGFALFGASVSLTSLDVLAPLDLWMFAALGVLSWELPRRARGLALVCGLTLLVLVETALCMWLVWAAYQESQGLAVGAAWARARGSVMASYTLGAPLLLWWVLPALWGANPAAGPAPGRRKEVRVAPRH